MSPARLRRRCWRMLAPRWSHDPLSGEGAARRGGRYNQPGRPALYMSESFTVAIAEYQQEIGVRPGTLCAYDIDVARVLDLCDPAICAAHGADPAALLAPWQAVAFKLRRRPPTWDLAERLLRDGADGVRVPSARMPGGVNVVLWRWNDGPGRSVAALDPLGDLPRDGSSWR